MTENGTVGREILPIPDRPYAGLVTYDAEDPDGTEPMLFSGDDVEDADHLITAEAARRDGAPVGMALLRRRRGEARPATGHR
jgi:hypothetical protein